ncbi:M56 family metallopeptidase [Roseimicrobium sp. ORNL1]|uniref:M56 family metallopeptidase n=1 Tax=Roseimicrobium sp. ORNL1 TaxID=2711231 RepID=UPI0013E11727|nr:M56 family metallopeptidase [Roseimicrobium sp. ORNL1]QIF00283.1 M48 family metalloprotease [Roseimicrobium sp. ORNL1]
MPALHKLTVAFDFALHASLLGAVGVILVLTIRGTLGRYIAPVARGWLWLPVALLCLSPRLPSVVGRSVSPEVIPATVREALAPVNTPVVVRGEPQLLSNHPMPAPQAPGTTLTLREKLAIGWGAGSIAIFGFWFVAYASLWKRIHREKGTVSQRLAEEFRDCVRTSGLRRAPGLIVTRAVDNPAVAGLWRPVVLMPPGLADSMQRESLRHVLLHELGHIRRGDLWLHWLSAIMVALHWFNPLLWLASRKFRADREAACDAEVIGASGNAAHAYGETLLALGARVPRMLSPRLMAGILGSADLVKQRIVDIARLGKTSRLAGWLAFLVVMSGTAAIALAAAEPGSATTIGDPPVKTETSQAAAELYTRTYKVPPDFLQWAQEQNSQPSTEKGSGKKLTAVQILTNVGVPFPEGASAVFVASTSQMIVRNTAANHDIIKALVEVNAANPIRQVYVTCQLVVFKEGSKPELLGISFTEPNQAIKVESTTGDEKPVMVQHPSPSPFAVSGVFTNPQFAVIWRTLAGKDKSSSSVPSSGGADVPFKNLSSEVQAVIQMPSVTTRSGQRATLETIREFIYPTEYDKKPSEKSGGKVEYTPKAFEMQPLGFVMEMEPVIGPDGYTIDLAMTPQLRTFTGWVDHALADGAKVKQPTFSTHKATTSVTIWDGQTVAFAGEAHIAPFLMDPSLKSEAAVLGKVHPMLLFVTTQMIDPSGHRVKPREGLEGKTNASDPVPPVSDSKTAGASHGKGTSRARIDVGTDYRPPNPNQTEEQTTTDFVGLQIEFLKSPQLRKRAEERMKIWNPDVETAPVVLTAERVRDTTQVEVFASATGSTAYARLFLDCLLDEMAAFRQERIRDQLNSGARSRVVDRLYEKETEVKELMEKFARATRENAAQQKLDEIKADLARVRGDLQAWEEKRKQVETAMLPERRAVERAKPFQIIEHPTTIETGEK